jgi:hypothetical protein
MNSLLIPAPVESLRPAIMLELLVSLSTQIRALDRNIEQIAAALSTFSAPSAATAICVVTDYASLHEEGKTARNERSSPWPASWQCCSIDSGSAAPHTTRSINARQLAA